MCKLLFAVAAAAMGAAFFMLLQMVFVSFVVFMFGLDFFLLCDGCIFLWKFAGHRLNRLFPSRCTKARSFVPRTPGT